MLTLLLALQVSSPLARTVDPIRAGQNILHYEFLISVPDEGDEITGFAWVHFRPETPSGALVLDFDEAMTVHAVNARGGPVVFHHAGDTLAIDVWGGVGDSVKVAIQFSGRPADGLFIQDNVHGRRSAFADNWPDRGHSWLPIEDHPSDKASVRWSIEVPRTWRAIANGRFVDTTRLANGRIQWRYHESRRIPAYTYVLGAGEITVTPLLTAAGVPQSLWTFAEDSAFAAEQPFRRVNDIVDVFTEFIGPFPYDKLAHVESSTRFGGMENSGAIFYTERGYVRRSMAETLVAHETAHQWFGDAATEYDWHHLWLSEGFATYFTALFYDLTGDRVRFRELMERSKRRYVNSNVVDQPILSFAETDYMRLLNANNYPKGGWVLHMLRRKIGDQAFQRGIRDYYHTFRDSTALSQDLRDVMERASGADLSTFFRQWLTQPGYPQLRVTVRRIGAPADGEAEVAVEQVQPEAWGWFAIPVRIDLVDSRTGQRATTSITMEGRRAVSRTRVPAGADTIEVDPDGDVLLTAETVWEGRSGSGRD